MGFDADLHFVVIIIRHISTYFYIKKLIFDILFIFYILFFVFLQLGVNF